NTNPTTTASGSTGSGTGNTNPTTTTAGGSTGSGTANTNPTTTASGGSTGSGTGDTGGSTVGPIAVGDFESFTQGGWGAKPHGNNAGALLASKFASVFPAGLTIGSGAKLVTFTSAT